MIDQINELTTLVLNTPPLADKKSTLKVTSFGMSDQGRIRHNNEDHFLIAELAKSMHILQSSLPQPKEQIGKHQGHLFVVADGMGGHQAGEQASAMAMGMIEEFILNRLKWFFHLQGSEEQNLVSEFQKALRQADARLIDEASRHPELSGMGTTLTMAYSLNHELFVVHVGDSRCYLFRSGQLHQLTRDHTIVNELVSRGLVTPEQAPQHHFRHIITNVIGGPKQGIEVEVYKVELKPDDVILLCSDGLTEMLTSERITAILLKELDPRKACEQLIKEANEKGGKDNVTVIVNRYEAD